MPLSVVCKAACLSSIILPNSTLLSPRRVRPWVIPRL